RSLSGRLIEPARLEQAGDGRPVAADRRHGFTRVETKRGGRRARSLAAERSVRIEIVGGKLGPRQWKGLFIPPASAVPQPAVLRFAAIAASHDEKLDGPFLIHAICRTVKPARAPAQPPFVEIQGSGRWKLHLSGVIASLLSVSPGPDDQFMR